MSRLTDRIFKKSENQINQVPNLGVSGLVTFGGRGRKNYADAYLWLVLNKIYNGIRNVNFFCDGYERLSPSDKKEIDRIINFVEANANSMLWWWWNKGFIVVGVNADGMYYVPDWNAVRTGTDRSVLDYDNVIYSDQYLFEGKPLFSILREHIELLDVYKNADDYLTNTLGTLAVMSSKEMGITPGEKRDLLDKMKRDYGIGEEKYQIMLMNSPVEVTQLGLPIKDLALSEKVKEEVMTIAGVFNVPYDLIPLSGASTYANQEQAIIDLYRNCISPLAETLLSVARYLLKKLPLVLVPSDSLTFKIDNVTELEDDRTAEVEYKLKLVELVEKMKAQGLETSEYEKTL